MLGCRASADPAYQSTPAPCQCIFITSLKRLLQRNLAYRAHTVAFLILLHQLLGSTHTRPLSTSHQAICEEMQLFLLPPRLQDRLASPSQRTHKLAVAPQSRVVSSSVHRCLRSLWRSWKGIQNRAPKMVNGWETKPYWEWLRAVQF